MMIYTGRRSEYIVFGAGKQTVLSPSLAHMRSFVKKKQQLTKAIYLGRVYNPKGTPLPIRELEEEPLLGGNHV